MIVSSGRSIACRFPGIVVASVEIIAVSKSFGRTRVLQDVDLSIADGEFLALLGPSGCGKTTLLRLIAGLERPDAGRILIGSEEMAAPGRFVEPEDRALGMVFQSYALWPHMSVFGNVEFGLAVQRVGRDERRRRVERALAAVGLTGLEHRRPQALSGGQRQRAALARCLALEPRLILLDEPLANLDAHLRHSMQIEFRRIHAESGTTFVFVTHDQVEAMALADRVAVMHEGQLQQLGTPEDLYSRPATAMVAGFVGKGALLPVSVNGPDGADGVSIDVGGQPMRAAGHSAPGPALLCLRPEDVQVTAARLAGCLAGTVELATYRGGGYAVDIRLPGVGNARVEANMLAPPPKGTPVGIRFGRGWLVAAPQAA